MDAMSLTNNSEKVVDSTSSSVTDFFDSYGFSKMKESSDSKSPTVTKLDTKDFSYLLNVHNFERNDCRYVTIPRIKKETFKVKKSPSIDLTNIRDLHHAKYIYLNNHRAGHFTLNTSGVNVQTAESGDGVVFTNTGKFPEYKDEYLYYHPQIYGSKHSSLLDKESVTIVYKDDKSKTYEMNTAVNAIDLKLRFPVVLLCINGSWNCELLLDNEVKNFVKTVRQYGKTYIYFDNVESEYQKGASSCILSGEQLKYSVNFSRFKTVSLRIFDVVTGVKPKSIDLEWWDYMAYHSEVMIPLYVG